ncbi:MAG: DUF484 family protein, partial [Methyloprofundus sp.]|nr:DUF484 family protein [Methyloprofundus sp.]
MEEDLTMDLMVLQSHLDSMLGRMQSNSTTLRRFHIFEMGLLHLNSLAEMLDYVLNSQDFFELDYIGFCLVDTKNELKKFLSEDGFDLEAKPRLIIFENSGLIKPTFGRSMAPYIGPYKIEKCANFFVIEKPEPASVTIIPFVRKEKIIGALCLGSFDPDRFVDTMSTDFIEHMTSVLGVCLENHLSYEAMTHTSFIDTLTGVNNRRFLEQRLGEEVDRAQRSIEALSCLFLDIDFFKKINDTYGHQAGDQVLMVVANVIRKQLRNNDVLVRYGGEEFIALLSNIEESMAQDIAERIRKKIKELVVDTEGVFISVTISIGNATYKPVQGVRLKTDQVGDELIQKADQALYSAKNAGRDRV